MIQINNVQEASRITAWKATGIKDLMYSRCLVTYNRHLMRLHIMNIY